MHNVGLARYCITPFTKEVCLDSYVYPVSFEMRDWHSLPIQILSLMVKTWGMKDSKPAQTN